MKILILIMLLFVSGCKKITPTIITDENGCQYITVYRGGITPRLDINGKHICNKVVK